MKPLSKTPNDFLQVTRGYLRDMRELAKRSPAAHQVLWLLAERMNKTNAVVISQKTMGQILGYSRSTLNRAINLLKDERWVQVIATGGSNAYVVNSKVLWRDQGGKRYAAFFAEVVVSADEQAHPVEEWDNVELRNMPILRGKEMPIVGNDELPPPDQQDLLPADPLEFPSAKADPDTGEIADPWQHLRRLSSEELEARGQQRLDV